MKIRKGFVTNSSSSSFLIARKEQLTQVQKEIILKYVEDTMLGERIGSTKEEVIKYYMDNYDSDIWENGKLNEEAWRAKDLKKCLEAVERGLCVYTGMVSFEDDEMLVDIFTELWKKLEEKSSFEGIDTSLEY